MTDQTPHNPSDDRGDYGLRPEPTPNPRPRSRPPIRVARLEYERHDEAMRYVTVPTAVQFILGMLSPFAFATIVGVLVALIPQEAPTAALLAVPGFVGIVIWIRLKTTWTGFVPGILTSVILLPVIGVVLCGMILSNLH